MTTTLAPTAAPARRHFVLRIGGTVLLIGLLAAVLVVMALAQALDTAPVQLVLDGETVWPPLALAGWSTGHLGWVALGLAVALLSLLVIVPLALAVAAASVLFALLLGVGLPVLIVTLLAAAALSPLLLLGWLLWRAVRPSPRMPA